MEQNDKKLFARPLIIGASVSAGYGTHDGGPGTILARRINPEAQITNLAYNGATSVQSTAQLDPLSLNPSIVLGFDLFFWDVARNKIGPKFEACTRDFFRKFQQLRIPMIIGKFPVVNFPFGLKAESFMKNALKVNELLEEVCSLQNNCLLYDPLDIYLQMKSFHFSDGLHLTSAGNEFCAQKFLDSADYKKLLLPSGI